MSRLRCFFLEPTDQVEMELRRYIGGEKGNPCPAPTAERGEHAIQKLITEVPMR